MKVCVLGIDGLTFNVVDPMIQAGRLPNFKRLKEEGAWGELRSTVPPYTPPAWMSIATGLKPTKHGVYDFWELDWSSGQIEAKLVTRRKAGRAIWEILGEYGKHVIVVNVPCTYPPDKVNGIMVSGFSAPSLDSNFTYPLEYRDELLRRFPNYQIDIQSLKDLSISNERSKLESVHRMTDVRIELLGNFLQDNKWDFLFFTFVGTDRLQHIFWDEIIGQTDSRVIQYYEKIDHALGLVRQSLGHQDWLLLVSDHGFHGAEQYVDLNLLLIELGLAKPRWESYLATAVARIAGPLGIKSSLRRLFTSSIEKNWFAGIGANISIESSQCVAVNGDGFGLVYSRKALDESTLESIADRIAERGVAQRSNILWGRTLEAEIGRGQFLKQSPIMAIITEPGWSFRAGIRHDDGAGQLPLRGVHDMKGVLLMTGPGVLPQQLQEASAIDIAPSILQIFNLPQESQFDGKSLPVLANLVSGNTLVRDERTGAIWDPAISAESSLMDRLQAITTRKS